MIIDKDEICTYLAEDIDFENLTDEEISEIADNICDLVQLDDELNKVINETIEYYANRYVYSKGE